MFVPSASAGSGPQATRACFRRRKGRSPWATPQLLSCFWLPLSLAVQGELPLEVREGAQVRAAWFAARAPLPASLMSCTGLGYLELEGVDYSYNPTYSSLLTTFGPQNHEK